MLTAERAYGCPPDLLPDMERIWQAALSQIYGILRDAAEEIERITDAPPRVHRGRASVEQLTDAHPFQHPTLPFHLGDGIGFSTPLTSVRLLIRDLDADWWAGADLQWVPGQPVDTGAADFWLSAGEGTPDLSRPGWNPRRRSGPDLHWTLTRRAGGQWQTAYPLRYDVQHPLLWALSAGSHTR
jgi:hypothetical protein